MDTLICLSGFTDPVLIRHFIRWQAARPDRTFITGLEMHFRNLRAIVDNEQIPAGTFNVSLFKDIACGVPLIIRHTPKHYVESDYGKGSRSLAGEFEEIILYAGASLCGLRLPYAKTGLGPIVYFKSYYPSVSFHLDIPERMWESVLFRRDQLMVKMANYEGLIDSVIFEVSGAKACNHLLEFLDDTRLHEYVRIGVQGAFIDTYPANALQALEQIGSPILMAVRLPQSIVTVESLTEFLGLFSARLAAPVEMPEVVDETVPSSDDATDEDDADAADATDGSELPEIKDLPE